VILVVVVCLLSVLVYNLPPVNERLAWRVEELRAYIKYAINPPEQVIFQPSEQGTLPTRETRLAAQASTPPPTSSPTSSGPTVTPSPTPSPTLTPTPLPPGELLSGFTHMYQTWNNCGPANLAMSLSYWGWRGDQRDTAAYTKPNPRDKNVMPYEMADFVTDETDISVLARVGGDLESLKAFIAAGFPVIVEKGFEGPQFDSWMGHYEVVNGYDDETSTFYVQDSYDGPNLRISYDDMLSQWRAFNYTYLVTFPPEREAEALAILGPHADPNYNYQYAADKASGEVIALSGRDQFFAWFNRGSSLARLHDYTGAATAYDAAFANYPSIPEDERPWRILWYQTGPYFAYYFTGRYEDVIELATTTLDIMNEPNLEESYYWRARAKIALGDTESAIDDLRLSLEYHPGFIPSIELLAQLGVEP
jgi:hypothetical protein